MPRPFCRLGDFSQGLESGTLCVLLLLYFKLELVLLTSIMGQFSMLMAVGEQFFLLL